MKRCILIAFLVALASAPAIASEEAYSTISDIPSPLREMVSRVFSSEQRVAADVSSILRRISRNKESLDMRDVEESEANGKRDARNKRLREIMRYDDDFDMKTTTAEIRAAMRNELKNNSSFLAKDRIAQYAEDALHRFLRKYDSDKDGVVTLKEAGTLPEGWVRDKESLGWDDPAAMMALDPDKDGIMTLTEISMLARKAFRTIDKNGDGVLSRHETEAAAAARSTRTNCTAPKAPESNKIVLVNVVEGGGISDVSLARQFVATGTVKLDIVQGDVPIYIVAISNRPVIWQVTGDTGRVSHISVAGPMSETGELSRDGLPTSMIEDHVMLAGVVGLAKEKVSFLKGEEGEECYFQGKTVMHSGMGNSFRVKFANSNDLPSIKNLVGREADVASDSYAPATVSIDSDKAVATVVAENAPPFLDYLDPEVWKHAQPLLPGGLVSFKNGNIITEAQTETYEVLPSWAGLAQLVHQGALEIEPSPKPATRVIVRDGTSMMIVQNLGDAAVVNNSVATIIVLDEKRFRIVKDIPNYPPGLEGGFGVRFVLPNGVAVPKGYSGSSCVIAEAEGETIGEDLICKD